MKSTFDIIGTIYYNNKWKTYITYMKGDLIMTLDEIKVVGIAGAGTMGASMAQIFAQYGYTVIIYDAFEAGLERGKHLVEINQASLVEAGDITAEQSAEIKTKLSFTGDINGLKDCDIIVESVLERLDVKQDFWVKAEAVVSPDCILATNTSGLSINKIFANCKDKTRACGMHWFNPPHIVPLIEVINNDETKQEIADTVYQLSLKIGKKPIYVKKDALGFIGNRIQAAILREAVYIVEQGIGDYKDVDGAMKYGLGFRYACLGKLLTRVVLMFIITSLHIFGKTFQTLSIHQVNSKQFTRLATTVLRQAKASMITAVTRLIRLSKLVTLCTLQWLNATQQVLVKHTATRTNISSL